MSIRKTSIIVTSLFALGAASLAVAGLPARAIEQHRQSSGGNAAPPPAPPPQSQPAPRSESAPVPRLSSPGSVPRANRPPQGGNEPPRGSRPGNPGHDRDGDRHHRHPRTVYVLPPVYYDYYWNGGRYYNFGGGWYRDYNGYYMGVGAPYGLFVSSLPGYSTSFYYGNTRYFLHDDTYYTYDSSRRGYVVSRSPYGDDEEDYEDSGEDLYIYPAKGQSEQQQADDRYACHRWGVKETGYDPIDDEYDRDRREEYQRAMTACLTGRGYSVR